LELTVTRTRAALGTVVVFSLALLAPLTAGANVALTRLSSDPYINTPGSHRTEVEPDTFAFGSRVVSAFQVGRFFGGGASNIGWATSADSGTTWTNGFLPGITTVGGGGYDWASDPSVAYDAAHGVWLVSSLALRQTSGGVTGAAVVANRSSDGGTTWTNPVVVTAPAAGNVDKNWTVCDNTATSPYYGHCYTEWDDNGAGNLIYMSTSVDGGLTWSARATTANRATGLGAQPLVQPNGTVVVPVDNANETAVLSFVSVDGGATWSSTVLVAPIADHTVAGNLRTSPLISAEIDGAGRVYVVWQDCRFQRGCLANDIVMSTSANGLNWSPVTRIPIDARTGADHFIPGIGVDRSTSGAGARLALAYYFYPVTGCTVRSCQLSVGFISSADGGATWSAPTQLAGPMALTWLPSTSQGYMVGDYISTSFSGGSAHPVFAVANPKGALFDVAMHSPAGGLAAARASGAVTARAEEGVPAAASDHPAPRGPVTNH
jgi:hypothetical protein